MSHQLWAAVVLLTLLTLVSAVEIQQLSAAASATGTHTTALAHALKSKRARLKTRAREASLRGLGSSADIAEDNNNNNDDDDDDDDHDDDEAEAMSAKAKAEAEPIVMTLNSKVSGEAAVKESAEVAAAAAEAAEEKKEKLKEEEELKKEEAAAEEAERKEHEKAEKAVQAAKKKQAKAAKDVKSVTDDDAFDAKIATETKIMTNETQSPALASFLGELRTEVRQYAMPTYPAYLQAKLDAANKKVETLEAELKSDKEGKATAETAATKSEGKAEKTEGKTEKATAEAKTGAEGGAEGESAAALAEKKAGETFALAMFATIAMLSIVFALASAEDKTVKNYTWFLIDQVVAIFLAVMYFNAFDSLLDFHALGVHAAVLCSILHAITMIAIVLGAAALLRKRKVALAILCGAGAHVVSFSSIHAAAGVQNKWMGVSYTHTMCIFGICTAVFTLAALGFVAYTSKRRANLHEDDEYMDKTDDVENDFAAMAVSVIWTMYMRFLITGHHPVDDASDGFGHTQGQRNAMLFYAIVCLIVAGFVTSFCTKKAAEPNASYAMKRMLAFVTTVATMNVAWAVLYWGEWEFFEAIYPGEAIKGKLMFAITMTMLGGVGLIGLSKIGQADRSAAAQTEKKVALVALSLVIAWSWELCFDAAVEAMCEGVAHPAGWKIALTLMLAVIVVPVYGLYMKPITSKAAEAIGA